MAEPTQAPDKKSLVHPGDLLGAIRTLFGSSATILDYDVTQGTETVQGFASIILRVKVKVGLGRQEVTETTLMVKRKPVMATHLEMLENMGEINERESIFFNQIMPLMEEKAGQLPLVKVLVAHNEAIVMEDLCASGYATVSKSMLDIGRGHALTFPLARATVRRLAKLHAASLDRDWMDAMPGYFDKDPGMDGAGAEAFKMFINNTLFNTVVPIMQKFYSDHPGIQKYIDFVKSPEFFDMAAEVVKDRTSFSPNVVLHGDCWLNNLMFKLEPVTKKVLDVKFIDLQIVRLGSPTIDLAYFLYSSANDDFRKKHEADLLKAYVEAFNTEANETPDLMQLNTFLEDYERARIFGVLMSMAFKSIQILPFFAPPDEGLTEEFFALAQDPTQWIEPTIKAYQEDEMTKNELDQLILHSIDALKKYIEKD